MGRTSFRLECYQPTVSRIHPSLHPQLQIGQSGPHVPSRAFGNLPGDGNGGRPPPGEECRENLVFRWLEADRLETGLEAFGQTAGIQVRRPEEGMSGRQAVKERRGRILRFPGLTVCLKVACE